MDICTRTLLPASDTFLGVAATGTLVSLIARVVLGPGLQVAISLLYFFICWAVVVTGTIVILLPFGTCQFAILINYMEYGVTPALGTSFTNVAILLSVSASILSSCLGAWNAVAEHTGDKKYLLDDGDRNWLAPVVLLANEAAGKCKEGMELSSRSRSVWSRLFWLWPRFLHNYLRGFRRLGSWAISCELKRSQPRRAANNSSAPGEQTTLLPEPRQQGTANTDSGNE